MENAIMDNDLYRMFSIEKVSPIMMINIINILIVQSLRS